MDNKMKKEKKNHTESNAVQIEKDIQKVAEQQDVQNGEAAIEEVSEEKEQQEQELRIAELTEKCAELTDKNLRLMAEFDNYRKRTLKEKSDLIKSAGESIFIDMLPLIDDFERAKAALESTNDLAAVKEGIDLIYNKFITFLNQKGVKAIETENADFNVEFHEAITTYPAPTEEQKGKIIDCVTKGYTLNDKVIRFSKVVVGE